MYLESKNSRKRRKSSHFLVVHFDSDQENNNSGGYSYSDEDNSITFSKQQVIRPNRHGYQARFNENERKPPLPRSLNDILPGTLQQHPPKLSVTRQYSTIEMARRIAAQRRLGSGSFKISREEHHDIQRRRRRKNRLEREERKRERRRQELEFQRMNAYKEYLWRSGSGVRRDD
ncbi:unnamed protein product [Thelazia callipaeda]|uniref:BZIP domain-containing protein n=1 Tax=Thelazia callipaeda TaxID=103827 RepID=A0A0N5DCB6_THECL|nr:unnamed protein product [Thelazia callipaeda]